jgi:polyisoprenoid-binding protein YceI
MKLAFPIIALALVSSAPALATDWTVDEEQSSLTFTATQSGSEFTGQFGTFDAAISLDPANLTSASIKVSVDMTSVNSNAADRDAQLPTGDWFDTAQFATAIFESSSIAHSGGNSYEATGKLSIKGAEQAVTLPFELTVNGNQASATGSLNLDRLDYSIGTGNWANESMVGFPVTVSFSIEANAN